MMTISLENLRFYAYHGVMTQENVVGNEYTVDLDVFLDSERLIENSLRPFDEERLEATVSYADLYEIVKEEMGKRAKLLETIAIRISDRIRTSFPEIRGGRVKICKTAPPIPCMSGSASVIYCWPEQNNISRNR